MGAKSTKFMIYYELWMEVSKKYNKIDDWSKIKYEVMQINQIKNFILSIITKYTWAILAVVKDSSFSSNCAELNSCSACSNFLSNSFNASSSVKFYKKIKINEIKNNKYYFKTIIVQYKKLFSILIYYV